MPIYNRANLIKETLISIKAQTYTNWECIIVDDASTDNTVEITKELIKKDARFQFYQRPLEVVKGPSACRNFAITKSKGDYIQFFDSDDIMHPHHLLKKREAIAENDFVVCKLLEFRGSFEEELYNQNTNEDIIMPKNFFVDFTTGKFPMMMVAPMWKKSSIAPYLPIREDLHILEDHELYARALFETKTCSIINECLVYYRIGLKSSTQNFYNNIDTGLISFLNAKSAVLKLTKSLEVKISVLKMTLGFFRQALAERNFKAANACLEFIKKEQLVYNLDLRLKMIRIRFFYAIFKVIKKGDTKFKALFKL